MYTVEFTDDASRLPKSIETVEIGKSSGFGQRHRDLLVFQTDIAFLNLTCFGSLDEYQFTQEALIWFDWVVVGFGHRIFLYEPKKHLSKLIDLDAYFCKLHTTSNILLATSGERIHALNSEAEILWISNWLGIDGVVINEITENYLLGEGEWDPPNGWRPFKINLNNGQVGWLK